MRIELARNRVALSDHLLLRRSNDGTAGMTDRLFARHTFASLPTELRKGFLWLSHPCERQRKRMSRGSLQSLHFAWRRRVQRKPDRCLPLDPSWYASRDLGRRYTWLRASCSDSAAQTEASDRRPIA